MITNTSNDREPVTPQAADEALYRDVPPVGARATRELDLLDEQPTARSLVRDQAGTPIEFNAGANTSPAMA